MDFLESYGEFVNENPLVAQMLTAGFMNTIGDILAQTIVERNPRFSWKRLFVMVSCGLFYMGPAIGLWLILLNSFEDIPMIAKVLSDQLIFSPTYLTGFFFIHGQLMGSSIQEWRRKIRFELFGILRRCWILWAPVQFINFKYVPFEYRMLLIQIVSIFWNTFLSVSANRKHKTPDPMSNV